MKKIINVVLLFIVLSKLSLGGEICLQVVKLMDMAALSSDYKKVAFYTYRHKMKLNYIQKNYALLAKVRNTNSSEMENHASITNNIVSIPTVQMASAEADIIAATNTINIALLDLLLYRSIKEEIVDQNKHLK